MLTVKELKIFSDPLLDGDQPLVLSKGACVWDSDRHAVQPQIPGLKSNW